ncbi:hypothetical protein Trydic_g23337 [Trypoxylus dichotomus]
MPKPSLCYTSQFTVATYTYPASASAALKKVCRRSTFYMPFVCGFVFSRIHITSTAVVYVCVPYKREREEWRKDVNLRPLIKLHTKAAILA